ncbi:hypothetical protein FQN53_005700 [Emmonsiellopsis sp. PD_33]|nr:hypothetical protein FQN53_005700 [Emmonsiellopsis sp. PD_33]
MAQGQRNLFNKVQLKDGLAALDAAMGADEWIYAFTPITMVSPGGFLAVSFFENRIATEDIDVIINPEHASDKDLMEPLHRIMGQVGYDLGYGTDWINDHVATFLTAETRKTLCKEAEQQNIILWDGPNLKVLAAPLEWGLESKLRRLTTKPLHPKAYTDVNDAVVILKHLIDRNKGPLKRNEVLAMNKNGFDFALKDHALDRVATEYRTQHGIEPFYD